VDGWDIVKVCKSVGRRGTGFLQEDSERFQLSTILILAGYSVSLSGGGREGGREGGGL